MSKVARGVGWLRDLANVLVLDRFHPDRKRSSELASTAVRTLHFHSRASLRQQSLSGILKQLGAQAIDRVELPGPQADFGDVGSHSYYYILGALVRGLRPKTVLEFGTYLGMSAYTMALNAPPETRIFTVDLPDQASAGAVPGLNAIDQGHIASSRNRVGEAFLGRPEEKRITQIRADSMTFQAEKVVPAADLILVDGGHSLAVVSKDTENAFRVLAPGGVILWDDYFHLYPDVVAFLNDLGRRHSLCRIHGTNSVVYQKPVAS